MAKAMRLRYFFALTAALIVCGSPICAQVYSYLDANGVRILTNTPPAGPVLDLRVNGAPPPAPAPAKTSSTTVSKASGNAAKGNSSRAATNAAPAKPSGELGTAQAASSSPSAGPSQEDATGYDAFIDKYAGEYEVDPKLIHSMIATESGYNSRAVSPKGAQGLMQLMPDTASRLGVHNPFDPEENISGGVKYMRILLDMFSYNPEDKLILSLAAYNAGENLVQRLGRVPAIRETNEYVQSILQRYGKRNMDAVTPSAPTVVRPVTFRYIDEKGVLVLTNYPPVQ